MSVSRDGGVDVWSPPNVVEAGIIRLNPGKSAGRPIELPEIRIRGEAPLFSTGREAQPQVTQMKRTTIAVVALAVLLIGAGAAAAAPGNAPDAAGDQAQADDHRQDDDRRPDDAGNASVSDDESDAASNASDASAGASDAAPADRPDSASGPPAELPEHVPDFVSEIHDLIRQHLGGDLDGNLGEAIAEVTPGDAAPQP